MSVTDASLTGMFEVHSEMSAEDFDDVHNHEFWRFLRGLARSDGGLKRLEAAIFDPAHAKSDTCHYAVKFCAERASDDGYARILERVLLEHPEEGRRVVAVKGLAGAGRYDAIERAHRTDGSKRVVTETAGHLVRRDARGIIPSGVDGSGRAVDAIFDSLWGYDGNDALYWGLDDHLNDAAKAIGFDAMLRVAYAVMTHGMSPKGYPAAAYRKIRKYGGERISGRINSMMARGLADSVMDGRETVARADVEAAAARYFERYL